MRLARARSQWLLPKIILAPKKKEITTQNTKKLESSSKFIISRETLFFIVADFIFFHFSPASAHPLRSGCFHPDSNSLERFLTSRSRHFVCLSISTRVELLGTRVGWLWSDGAHLSTHFYELSYIGAELSVVVVYKTSFFFVQMLSLLWSRLRTFVQLFSHFFAAAAACWSLDGIWLMVRKFLCKVSRWILWWRKQHFGAGGEMKKSGMMIARMYLQICDSASYSDYICSTVQLLWMIFMHDQFDLLLVL